MLKVTNPSKIYKTGSVEVRALDGVSFAVPTGDMVCIMGKSGSGKSTLLRQLVAGVTIFIVTYMDVINKRHQIGIQRVIGIKNLAIMFSYLIRALCYVEVGLIGACFLFEYAVMLFEAGHPFIFPFGPVYLSMDIAQMIHTAVLLLAVSLIAAFIPVWPTIRIKILDSIWG